MNTTRDYRLTTIVTPHVAQTAADVEAAIRTAMHERALVIDVDVQHLPGTPLVAVTVTYDGGAGAAEVQDVAHRIGTMTGLTHDEVRIH